MATAQQELLAKETFVGVKQLLEQSMVGLKPIVFIIQNIKAFNHVVLNELIHLLRKYRRPQLGATRHGCNLCLMLGV